ncbi:MAG TPA: CapA family protein [Vicinamibacterales bacterium]|nr:CapA family protein [Vicinamibacterales bacterium]
MKKHGVFTAALVAGFALVPRSPLAQSRPQAPALSPERELAMKISVPFAVAAAGDLIEMHTVSQLSDPSVQALLKIIQQSDIGFANMESNLVDMQTYQGHFTDHTGPKEVAADVKAMGFRIVSRANNHTTDAGPQVMFSTNRLLDQAGVVHAGSGKDLEEARAARFVESPKGRVALVSMSSTSAGAGGGSEAATYRFGDTGGAPGVNALRLTKYNVVSQEELETLRKIRDDAYAHRGEVPNAVPPLPANEPHDRLNLFGTWFKAGTPPAGLSYAMNGEDLREILRSIRNGKEQSSFLIAAIHTHEDTTSLVMPFLSEYPADFLVELAHKAIDNGADMFVGTGIHALRSIEIYKGKPIFYGLAQFVYQLNQGTVGLERYTRQALNPFTTEKTDAELNWEAWADPSQTRLGQDNMESVVAECQYQGGRLASVRLHPIDLGYSAPLSEKGIPRAASAEVAQRILQRLQRISKPYGTSISIEKGVGVIRVSTSTE